MISLSTLATFSLAVLFLLCSPGPNMAFVMTCGVQYGVRGGVAAALGIGAADIVLTVLTASGITAVITAWPPSFDLLRYAGALYLLWLAYKALRRPAMVMQASVAAFSLRTVFVQSSLNSLFNPKAWLFFMVFLPQFVDTQNGMVVQQLLLLGLVLTLISSLFHAMLGSFGHAMRGVLARHAYAARLQAWLLAAMLVTLALRLMLMTR